MRRNCNLELGLFPCHDSGYNQHHPIMGEGNDNNNNNNNEGEMNPEVEGRQQKLTIFYDGKVCVSDVTDLQARWIMKEASKEMAEEKMKRSLSSSSSAAAAMSGLSESQMCSPNTALSMKRSLQRFLQKRKDRIHESSPYHPSLH